MSKVELSTVASGYALSVINENFQAIEDELNNNVLYRDNPAGEPNSMDNNLDMNSFQIINLPAPATLNSPARIQDVQDAIAGETSAALISFSPTGTIAATTAQGAIAEVSSDLADTNNVANGDAQVGVKKTLTNAEASTQHAVNEKRDVYVGVDYSTPALAFTNSGKKKIFLPAGTYSGAALTMTSNQQHLHGEGWSSEENENAGTTFQKNANGTHFTLSGYDCSISKVNLNGLKASFTGDGLVVAGRCAVITDTAVQRQAGDGVKLGSTGNNNLWRAFNLVSIYNGGRGIYQNHTGGTVTGTYPLGIPDVNAGVAVGGDIRGNAGIGWEFNNTIDTLVLGTAIQDNVSKGAVFRANARGHFLVKPYTEGNNGGAGAAGDEIDFELGAVQNGILGMRFQDSGGAYAGIRDVNAPGKNWIVHYDPGLGNGEWAQRSKLSVWNPQQDGSSTSVDFSNYLGANQVEVYTLKGSIEGTSGGRLTIQTKRDGNISTDKVSIGQDGKVFVHNVSGTVGVYLGATTSAPGIFTGTGSPEGVVTAVIGSMYTNQSGGASTTLYIKTSGSGNTGWTAK